MASQISDDPFSFEDSLLNLEEEFYQQGYAQGVSDGVKAGRTEGRQLGLEKGFQKFVQSGRLHGRAIVWANRLPSKQAIRQEYFSSHGQQSTTTTQSETAADAEKEQRVKYVEGQLSSLSLSDKVQGQELPLLPNNARLQKHITTLFALVETDTLAKENTDEGVNDFDDRLKRAQGKAKIVERMVGEGSKGKSGGGEKAGSAVGSPGTGEGGGSGQGTPIADLGAVGNEV